MSKTEGDFHSTLLYKNAKAVQQKLEVQGDEILGLKADLKRLRDELTVANQESAALRHMVDTMWVKWMGHGPTG